MVEFGGARRTAADRASRLRLCRDLLLFRVLKLAPGLEAVARQRTVRVGRSTITYRLNRGDIQSIREVWLDEAYAAQYPERDFILFDLGANIGLASVWFNDRFGCQRVVAVEPDPENATLVRRNLAQNQIDGEVVQAAVAPTDGTASFARAAASNLGSLNVRTHETSSITVQTRTPRSILDEYGIQSVDVCKLDIEGGEYPLMCTGDTVWLRSVAILIAEVHHEVIDGPAVISAMADAGLAHRPPVPGSHKLDLFVNQTEIVALSI